MFPDFNDIDWTCSLSGNECEFVPEGSTSSFSLRFDKGVPPIYTTVGGTPSEDKLELIYTYKSDGSGAVVDNSFASLTGQPAFAIGTPASGVACSFAGGCSYQVSGGAGQAALLAGGIMTIEVCGLPCEYDAANSDATSATCTMPPLATTYSASEYEIVQSAELDIDFTGTGDDMSVLSDGVNTIDSSDSSSSDCVVQADAQSGNTFILDAVRIFFNQIDNKSPFIDGNLKF